MSDKKRSLSQRSIIRLVILGLIIFLGTGLAGGIQLYRQNLKVYKDAADSYSSMLCYQIDEVDISDIIQQEDDICQIQRSVNEMSEEAFSTDQFSKVLEDAGEEAANAYNQWNIIESFVIGFGNICKDIRYAYVAIPSDKDLKYIWDSDIDQSDTITPFEHVPYTEGEKEYIQAVMKGDAESVFFTESMKGGELLGTFLRPVYNENAQICAVSAIDISISSIRTATVKLLLNIALTIILIMIVSITVYHYVVSKQIIKPILTLTRSADGLVNNLRKEGSEPFYVDVHTGDEIDVLARSFERMDEKLLEYIRENESITAEKERIETELSLAARIQRDMLPRIFPPFPERKEIDLYASMDPAKEIGGDYYDFFLEGENRLWLVMADVSGKGIPAALFMMMCKIMVQNFALTFDGPAEVLEKVNDQICENMIEEMFVTVWLGVLDLKTGRLRAVNAGHEYPILKAPGRDFEMIRDRHGLVVGAMEGSRYQEYQMQLAAGTRLFVYTDGLPEATDAEDEMFGTKRLLKALNEVKEEPPGVVLEHVKRSVTAFVGSAPQFDDMTMLCVDYDGSASSDE